MAGNCSEGLGDDFFEQILAVPSAYTNGGEASSIGYGNGRTVGDVGPMTMPMVLQLGSTSGGGGGDGSGGGGGLRGSLGIGVDMPLGLNLEQRFLRHQDTTRPFSDAVVNVEGSSNNHQRHLRLNNNNSTTSSSSSTAGITDRDSMHMRGMFSAFGQLRAQSMRPTLPSPAQTQLHLHRHRHHEQQQPFHSQPPTPAVSAAAIQQPQLQPQPPGIRPRVRARRGQATDPHSIAERLRRERIAERMKALQELVPSINKTDRAAMLDEIVDYVKFLRLQVKVLSMSRLGGAGAVAQLVADVPPSAVEGEGIEDGANQQAWDKWSNDGTEQEVAKLMEEDVGAAMQFLQSKALCIMPISLASAIFRMPMPQSEAPTLIKPESNTQS